MRDSMFVIESLDPSVCMQANKKRFLLDVLKEHAYPIESECNGKGTCQSCEVEIEGVGLVQSCQWLIQSDLKISRKKIT